MEIAVSDFNSSGDLTQKVLHTYDAFNRWIGQTIDDDGDGTVDTTRQFVQDGGQVTLAFKDGQLTNRYLWSTAVDELLADESIASGQIYGATRWALTDHLGSVRDLVNTESEIVYHAVYDAYGKVLTIDGEADSLFGFTGRAYDNTTGLQNNHNRWYDSGTGRWLSQDPIGFAAGDTNVYRYVLNRPLNFVDSAGLDHEGHHLVPQELWAYFGFDLDIAKEVFDSENARILTDAMQEPDNYHNFTSHGPKYGYTGHVSDAMNSQLCSFMTEREKKRGLSKKRQKEFAEHFLQYIKDQKPGTFIADFNKAVRDGRRGQLYFKRNYHKNYPAPAYYEPAVNVTTGRPPVPIKGRVVSYGGKALRIAPALAWFLSYNELRAEGVSPSVAAGRASLDEVLCTESIADVMAVGGEAYSDAMWWGIERNKSREVVGDPYNPKVKTDGLIKRTNPRK